MLRSMFRRLSESMRRFLWGRCGLDQLNIFLLAASVVLCLLGRVLSVFGAVAVLVGSLLNALALALLIWYFFRALSRNLDKRARENRRYLTLKARITDRSSRYYRCPNCRQTVRVPRGRGKICIKCPKCSEKFIRKS